MSCHLVDSSIQKRDNIEIIWFAHPRGEKNSGILAQPYLALFFVHPYTSCAALWTHDPSTSDKAHIKGF